jgi:hypothetical protein
MSDTEPVPERERLRGWRRYGSPACLLLTLLLFPLPWVEIQCAGQSRRLPAAAAAAKRQLPEWAERVLLGEETQTLFTESGLQAALGTYSHDPKSADREGLETLNACMKPSLLMGVLPVFLVAGVGIGLGLPSGRWRAALLAVCAVAALALVLSQMAVGFPVDLGVAEMIARDPHKEDYADPSGDTGFRTRYTPWLMLALLAIVGSLTLACWEWYVRGKSTRAAVPAHRDPCRLVRQG